MNIAPHFTYLLIYLLTEVFLHFVNLYLKVNQQSRNGLATHD